MPETRERNPIFNPEEGDILHLVDGLYVLVDAVSSMPGQPISQRHGHTVKNNSNVIEKNHYALTEDGCFIGYKMLREDWTDYYSGKIDNSIGQIVKVERQAVNHDRSACSSYGLHVAALNDPPEALFVFPATCY